MNLKKETHDERHNAEQTRDLQGLETYKESTQISYSSKRDHETTSADTEKIKEKKPKKVIVTFFKKIPTAITTNYRHINRNNQAEESSKHFKTKKMNKIIFTVVAAFSTIVSKINKEFALGLLLVGIAAGVSAYTNREKVETSSIAMTTFYPKPGTPPSGLADPNNWTDTPLGTPPNCSGGSELCAIEVNIGDLENNLPSSEALETFESNWRDTTHGQEVEDSGIIVLKQP